MKSALPVVGIIGGGQLGRMMLYDALRMGLRVNVLDPDPAAPCATLAERFFQGSLHDPDSLRRLVGVSDVTTYEIEHVNTAALADLAASGAKIQPEPRVLAIIQDKARQKALLRDAGVPVPGFVLVDDPAAWQPDASAFPCVQKTRHGGYDGRGVALLRGPQDERLKGPSMMEDLVDIEVELAVIVARGLDGSEVVYPVVEMMFDPRRNICDTVLCPARLDADVTQAAQEIALKAVDALGGVGVFGVELFLTRDRKILCNEIAPRPHNSGHLTIEACETSQFEQHLRAVSGLPLGDASLRRPAVMVNLLGMPGWEGAPLVEGLEKALAVKGFHFHWYGKEECRPFRKMGHFTVTGDSVMDALDGADKVRALLRVKGERPCRS